MSEMVISQSAAALSGSYRIERELGSGGMSRMFVACAEALDREVVIRLTLPKG